MSSAVTAKCSKCHHPVTVEEVVAVLPVACESCQTQFIPAAIIAESNKRFEIWMYVVMLGIGVGLIGYMAATGNLKPKADPAGTGEAPAAAEAETGG